MFSCRSYQDIPDDPRDRYLYDEEEEQEEECEECDDDEDCGGMDCVDRWKAQHGIEF